MFPAFRNGVDKKEGFHERGALESAIENSLPDERYVAMHWGSVEGKLTRVFV